MFKLKTLFSSLPKSELYGKWQRQWESLLKYSGGSETLCFKPDGRFKIILTEFYEGEKFKAIERGRYIYFKEERRVLLNYTGKASSAHEQEEEEIWTDVRISDNRLELRDECNHLWNYTKLKN